MEHVRFWFCAEDVNVLGGSITTIKKMSQDLIIASKENGMETNNDKTKYMVVSQDQDTRRSHIVKIDNSSFQMVEEFKYLGTLFKNQNSFQKEIKS